MGAGTSAPFRALVEPANKQQLQRATRMLAELAVGNGIEGRLMVFILHTLREARPRVSENLRLPMPASAEQGRTTPLFDEEPLGRHRQVPKTAFRT